MKRTVFYELLIRLRDYFNPKKLTWREALRRILLYACVVVFLVYGFQVVEKYYTDYVTQSRYENMMLDFDPMPTDKSDQYFETPVEEEESFELIDLSEYTEITSKYSYNIPEYEAGDKLTPSGRIIGSQYADVLNNVNDDVIGYINIAGTNVDYFVLQYRMDNDFYLNHTIELKKAKAASIFMDYRNRPYGEDQNTILYGHNMKNGSMFRTLHNYEKKEFAMEHRYITFSTLYEDMVWEVFASYKTHISFDYIQTSFRTTNDYAEFLKTCKSKSAFKYAATPTAEDRILTLSTCDSNEEYRYVVQAVLVSRTKR